jgi:hypothetical protein
MKWETRIKVRKNNNKIRKRGKVKFETRPKNTTKGKGD